MSQESKHADLLNVLDAMAGNMHYAVRRQELRQAEQLIVEQEEALDSALARAERAEAAIRKHHDRHADDLCWMDDNELYAAIGLPPREPTVGDPAAMLANCQRYIAQRCKPGGDWKSYAELEARLAECEAEVRELREQLKIPHPDRDIVNECNVLLAAKDKEITRLRAALESRDA
jgi:hypothetical protein